MDRAHLGETTRVSCDQDFPSWVSVCPRGFWRVERKQTLECPQHTSNNTADVTSFLDNYHPKLGSLCRVHVQLKDPSNGRDGSECEEEHERSHSAEATELAVSPFVRDLESVLQVPLGEWTSLTLGEGQCDIIEACLEGMRAGEKYEIELTPVGNGAESSAQQHAGCKLPLRASVELQHFTPGKESWEMTPKEKLEWVKSHKERGGVRFRSGDVWGATDSYSRALKLLIPLYGLVGQLEKKAQEMGDADFLEEPLPSSGELRVIKAELHSNLSLCQLKLNQPEQAKCSAAKATRLEPAACKAWYRLGRACQVLNELEEAKEAFKQLLELQPELPAAVKALKDVISREKERNAQLGQRLSKMFS